MVAQMTGIHTNADVNIPHLGFEISFGVYATQYLRRNIHL